MIEIELNGDEVATLFWLVFGGRPIAHTAVETLLRRLETKFEPHADVLRSPPTEARFKLVKIDD